MNAIRVVDDCLTCLTADAIYYGNEFYSPVVGRPEQELIVKSKLHLSKHPETGRTDLDTTVEIANDEFLAFAGETNWGGTGFIALKKISDELPLWVLHLSTMNNPVKIELGDGIVTVVTDLSYPNGIEFLIPFDKPENLKTRIPEANKT